MWKKLFGYFAHLLTVAEATRENKAEIVQMRSELRDLALSVQLLAHDPAARHGKTYAATGERTIEV